MSDMLIRPWREGDSISELTTLLHQAYAVWAERDIRFTATDQSEEKTLERITDTFTFVAELEGRLLGTITLHDHAQWHDLQYYRRPGVWFFGQFGVLPEFKRTGLGACLMATVESYAREHGASELACDTAEPAIELHDYYAQKGYVQVGIHDWKFANNRSLIFTKVLA